MGDDMSEDDEFSEEEYWAELEDDLLEEDEDPEDD